MKNLQTFLVEYKFLNRTIIFKLCLLLLITTMLSGCVINEDWHTHRLEIDTKTLTVTVDEVISSDFTCSIDNAGITLLINEKIDAVTWHWNITNDDGVRFEPEIIYIDNYSEVFIPHDFEKYPGTLFVATTYLKESYLHFIGNIKQL